MMLLAYYTTHLQYMFERFYKFEIVVWETFILCIHPPNE